MKTLADTLGLNVPPPERPLGKKDDPLEGLEFTEICQRILTTPEYRMSLMHRIVTGTLPPAVEVRMIDAAYGKATEKIEVTTEKPIKECDYSELRERVGRLLNAIREKEAQDAVLLPEADTKTTH